MRILIANEGIAGAGGVESYLARLLPALAARGHELGLLHYNSARETGPTSLPCEGIPTFGVLDEGRESVMARVLAWNPEVCFSHNMRALDVDAALVRAMPTVKMMHGYFGTCVSGQKANGRRAIAPCPREFGPACLALYLPKRCGPRRPWAMVRGYSWALRQRRLFAGYAEVVVASEHMRDEYVRHGAPSSRVTVAPLFSTIAAPSESRALPLAPMVLFAGRMTPLKGGDVLVKAAAHATRALGGPLSLVLAGDGPEKRRWQDLAAAHGVPASFPGWVDGDGLGRLMQGASLLAVPSVWPEPFGLVGIEAGSHGVPAVAFDTGGIGQWLRDGVNGQLVSPVGDPAALGSAIAGLVMDREALGRLGRGARSVAAELSLDAHVTRLEAVFARAVSA
jgi:glycosyltransferase involved in cell wall biosynthesis